MQTGISSAVFSNDCLVAATTTVVMFVSQTNRLQQESYCDSPVLPWIEHWCYIFHVRIDWLEIRNLSTQTNSVMNPKIIKGVLKEEQMTSDLQRRGNTSQTKSFISLLDILLIMLCYCVNANNRVIVIIAMCHNSTMAEINYLSIAATTGLYSISN